MEQHFSLTLTLHVSIPFFFTNSLASSAKKRKKYVIIKGTGLRTPERFTLLLNPSFIILWFNRIYRCSNVLLLQITLTQNTSSKGQSNQATMAGHWHMCKWLWGFTSVKKRRSVIKKHLHAICMLIKSKIFFPDSSMPDTWTKTQAGKWLLSQMCFMACWILPQTSWCQGD